VGRVAWRLGPPGFRRATQSRRRQPLDIRALHPLAVYIALAPFITPDAAGPLIASKLMDASTCTPRAPGPTVVR
jgi:hypothetical protein